MVDFEPKREQTPNGFVEVASNDEVTPPNDIKDGPWDRTETLELDPEDPPHLRMEQIQARL